MEILPFHGHNGLRSGSLPLGLRGLPTGAPIVCTFGGALVVMFFVHLLFFHGRNAHSLEGASSMPKPIERVRSREKYSWLDAFHTDSLRRVQRKAVRLE